jgi:hypothetical protein
MLSANIPCLLDVTSDEVQVDPSNVNPASGGTFQAVGSVPGGSLQCKLEARHSSITRLYDLTSKITHRNGRKDQAAESTEVKLTNS